MPMKRDVLEALAREIAAALRPHLRRIGELESTVRGLQHKDADRPLREKLARLEARVDELEAAKAATAWGE